MRADLDQSELTASPAQPFVLCVGLANTSPVIDAISATVAGLPGATVSSTPASLSLFPGTSGTLSLRVVLPKDFPAGRHQATVHLRSAVLPEDGIERPVQIDVAAAVCASLTLTPSTRRGHRKGSFAVHCANEGNIALEVSLSATDPERALHLSFHPGKLFVKPGAVGEATLNVRAPRQLFGSERARQVSVSANVAGAPPRDARVGARVTAISREAQATYTQHPRVSRGLATACILAAIVVLWAAIFSFGLKSVLAEQPLAKSAPLSFFAPLSSGPSRAGGGAPVAGFAPKDFAPLGAAGSISGTVTSPGQPGGVGRLTVQAVELGPGGGAPATAATQANGSYQVAGLFPGHYKVSFSAPGFKTIWYGGASRERAARVVEVGAESTLQNVDVVVHGLPGSIKGQVMTGELPSPPVQVTAVAVSAVPPSATSPAQGGSYGAIARGHAGHALSARAGASGTFSFAHLASPATYELTFRSRQFLQASEQVYVGGGQAAVANTVQLQANAGKIEGTVSDGGKPLGGVNVSASAGGNSFSAITPTAGPVGTFSLTGLPTPATYLLTFTKAGYGTDTEAVDLGPGRAITKLHVALAGGAGTVSGRVFGPNGQPLGGVAVTVGGQANPVTTETLTAGYVGTYTLSGLPTPGTYALTFSRPGYASETVGVALGSRGLARGVDVTLPGALGQISGRVVNARTGGDLAGVNVVITDGPTTVQTTTTPEGNYSLAELSAGTYSVTFSLPGYTSETALVQLRPGKVSRQDVSLRTRP